MSKERELLKQIQQFLLCDCEDIYGFARDIEQLLEQPEEDQTPYCNTGLLEVWENGHDTGLRSAETTREPLSDEWIKNNIHFIHRDVSFAELVRAIEKAHGIGVDNETV
jgi:hypothetical protein